MRDRWLDQRALYSLYGSPGRGQPVEFAEETYERERTGLFGTTTRERYRFRVPIYPQPSIDPAQLVEGFLAALEEMRADIRLDRTLLFRAVEALAARSGVAPLPAARPEWLGRLDYDPARRPYADVDYDDLARRLVEQARPIPLPLPLDVKNRPQSP